MEIRSFLEKKIIIHKKLLEFISNVSNDDEVFQNLINIISEQKILENAQELKIFLRLILKISNNHNRIPYFFQKIEQIIKFYADKIKQTFSNYQIFKIFKSNKRILLFIFEEKIIKADESIVKIITNKKYSNMNYPLYFSKEIDSFIDDEMREKIKNNSTDFQNKRIIGENDSYICQLIRNDSIDEFISYVNQNCIFLSMTIEESIFETNLFLLKNNPTLIEYAAFFGSIQIFKYLFLNKVALTPFLWLFAIHGNNAELISYLEEMKFQKYYKKCLIESIKCHHIEITNYIIDNYSENKFDIEILLNISHIIKFHNFSLFPKDLIIKESILYYFCQYDYYNIVENILKTKRLNLNAIVSVHFYQIFFF